MHIAKPVLITKVKLSKSMKVKQLLSPGVIVIINEKTELNYLGLICFYADMDATSRNPFKPYNENILYNGQPIALVVETFETARYADFIIGNNAKKKLLKPSWQHI
jgi:hypothetical protein